ncbi:MAG: pyridinium-3,5-biscarboxylic acid mononucleotide synthase [Frankiaceae bacterium]|nr:pyridinium-3,5-biscarboxylic acid mononucleotide synthase [Frankiaceae bacterium]
MSPESPQPAFVDLGFARVDVGREARQGLPEVVYGPGKSASDIAAIVGQLLAANSGPVLVTRIERDVAHDVAAQMHGSAYDEAGRVLSWRAAEPSAYAIAIVTAGTADRAAADEAHAVATAVGIRVRDYRDVGVAGLHRLLSVADELAAADAVIVIAGMEAALASAVGGLVGCPVIAVPTSTGYGAALDGVTALLGMLSSCAAGLTVVNIDSGFGAAMAAHRLAHTARRLG